MLRWLSEARVASLAIFAPIAIWGVVDLTFDCLEREVRISGLALQLVGFTTVDRAYSRRASFSASLLFAKI